MGISGPRLSTSAASALLNAKDVALVVLIVRAVQSGTTSMLVPVQATVPADFMRTQMEFVLPARLLTVLSAPTMFALSAYPNPCR